MTNAIPSSFHPLPWFLLHIRAAVHFPRFPVPPVVDVPCLHTSALAILAALCTFQARFSAGGPYLYIRPNTKNVRGRCTNSIIR